MKSAVMRRWCGAWLALLVGCEAGREVGPQPPPAPGARVDALWTGAQDVSWGRVGAQALDSAVVTVPVCFVSADPRWGPVRQFVRRSLEESWAAVARLEFTGFANCPTSGPSRHVRVNLVTATTFDGGGQAGVGKQATFKTAAEGSSVTINVPLTGDRARLKYLVVHEFGHVLGFPHEEDRSDASGCNQGTPIHEGQFLTPYDPQSVMNNCATGSAWAGVLTPRDRAGVISLYGARDVSAEFAQSTGWGQLPRVLADVSGDGRADIVGFGNGVWVQILGTFGSFAPASQWSADFASGWTTSRHVRTVADVTGDRRGDLVGFGEDGVYVGVNTSDAFGRFSGATRWTTQFGVTGGWQVGRHVRTLADVNGDGRADIVGFGEHEVLVALSTGSGFLPHVAWSTEFVAGSGWDPAWPRLVGDVNGDGKADLVTLGASSVRVALSTGSAFAASYPAGTQFTDADGWRSPNFERMLADVDGDRRADLVGFSSYGVWFGLSNGSAFGTSGTWGTAFSDASWRPGYNPRLAADLDGDGRADFVGFADETVRFIGSAP